MFITQIPSHLAALIIIACVLLFIAIERYRHLVARQKARRQRLAEVLALGYEHALPPRQMARELTDAERPRVHCKRDLPASHGQRGGRS
jgi:hypothetical protein